MAEAGNHRISQGCMPPRHRSGNRGIDQDFGGVCRGGHGIPFSKDTGRRIRTVDQHEQLIRQRLGPIRADRPAQVKQSLSHFFFVGQGDGSGAGAFLGEFRRGVYERAAAILRPPYPGAATRASFDGKLR